MCLAIPAQLIRVEGNQGVVKMAGGELAVGLQLVDNPRPGQYVLVHAGFALETIEAAEAQELEYMLAKLSEINPTEGAHDNE